MELTENQKLDMFAQSALTGILSGKEVIASRGMSGDMRTAARTMAADKSKTVTPEEAAYWAYEIAKEMLKKSKN